MSRNGSSIPASISGYWFLHLNLVKFRSLWLECTAVTASRPVNLCLLICGQFGGCSSRGKDCSVDGIGEHRSSSIRRERLCCSWCVNVGCSVDGIGEHRSSSIRRERLCCSWCVNVGIAYQRPLTLCQWIAGVPAILFRN